MWVYLVVLGAGKQLFADRTVPTALRLTASTTFTSGAALLAYRPDGEPTFGTMACDADQTS